MKVPTQSQRALRFGVFEFDAQAAELRKNGVKIKLHGQPLEILALLLEHPGEPVTREELQKKLWPADTFVEFEHSLNAAVMRLREALGDSADNPRFVETIPRRGYRFIAPVEALERQRWARPRAWQVGLVTAAVFLVVAAVWFFHFRTAQALAESDYILLTDVVNTTGDQIFDGTLKQALAVKLEESPFFNIFPERRVRETLRLMERDPDAPVTQAIGQEICERQGIKAMLVAEIAPLGSHYVISLNAVYGRTGDSLAREQVEAESKEKVLASLGKATSSLRRKLGESLASVEQFDTPVERTTSSLEALKAYTVGGQKARKGREAEAIPFLEHAIELDPEFAVAYASLGIRYWELGELEKGARCLKKAFDLRDHASESEKLHISSMYYAMVTGETHKEMETYEIWEQLYPRNSTLAPWNNHSVLCNNLGDFVRAAELARKAIELRPDHRSAHENLGIAYLGLNRFSGAKAILQDPVERNIASTFGLGLLYAIAFAEGDIVAMQRHADSAASRPDEHLMLERRANASAFSGRMREARKLRGQAAQSALRGEFKEIAASLMALGAEIEAEIGNYETARKDAEVALASSRTLQVEIPAAQALALSNQLRQAEALADDLKRRFPVDTLLQAVSLPLLRARIESQQGNPKRAIELLRAATPYELGSQNDLHRDFAFSAIYARSRAYLQAGSGQEAANEFQRILDHRGVDPTCPLYALAHLGLARAHALTGDRTKAKKKYEDFLTLWKDADPDIPIYQQAKAEYAKLK